MGRASVGFLPQQDGLNAPVDLIGTGYFAWISRDTWRASGSSVPVSASWRWDDGSTEALRSGIVLSLTNPQNVACLPWAAPSDSSASTNLR